MTTRPVLVQKMLDSIKRHGDYREHVPKAWMDADYGMEHALVKYVEDLEAQLVRSRRAPKKKKEV